MTITRHTRRIEEDGRLYHIEINQEKGESCWRTRLVRMIDESRGIVLDERIYSTKQKAQRRMGDLTEQILAGDWA